MEEKINENSDNKTQEKELNIDDVLIFLNSYQSIKFHVDFSPLKPSEIATYKKIC